MSKQAPVETGFYPEGTLEAIDRLEPYVQQIIDAGHKIDVVLGTLAEGFFASLRAGGAGAWQMERWSKRNIGIMGAHGEYIEGVQEAYAIIGPEITAMIKDESYTPKAVAWCLKSTIIHIVRRVPGLHQYAVDQLITDLLKHIDEFDDEE